MTRINLGIPPKTLTDKHLIAEHREIKRIPNHLRKHGDKCLKKAPPKFTLGKGHVLFFIAYGEYTFQRYVQIHEECKARGFNVTDFSAAWLIYTKYPALYNNYTPPLIEVLSIRERLMDKNPKYAKLWG